MEPSQTQQFLLPVSVVGLVDLGRLARELELLDAVLHEATLRGDIEVKVPKTSHLMDQLIEATRVDLAQPKHREWLASTLAILKQQAPRVHMSFSADPSPQFVAKVLQWFRTEIHPYVLLTIGLQPSIGAGCMLRTTNKYFDLSLAKNMSKHTDILIQKLRGQGV
ncbi:MAG TPA: hypothetical protein PLT04_04655 [Candidatus Saccharibacteria bacterium]|nr:hypothetical protein [Candidatus Saccharibacteria bacterium]